MKNRTTSPLKMAQKLAAEFAPRATEADRTGTLPPEDVQALRQSGYLGLSVPQEFGGHGLSLRDCVAAQIELAQGSGATALVAGMQMHLFGHAREIQSWPAESYERLCRMAAEGYLFNSVASEPQLGSPSRGGLPNSTATPSADHEQWIINGHKTWVTGGQHLTHMLVQLNLDDRVAVILVPQEAEGIKWEQTWQDALCFRASESHDVYFDNVRVPTGNLINRATEQVKPRPNAWFPMVLAATYLGEALAARDALIRYTLERVPTALGKPIATLPKIQRQVGEIDIALQAAQALLFEVAAEWTGQFSDRARQYPRIASAKAFVLDAVNEATQQALVVAGGASLNQGLPLERHFRNVRAGLMQPPSGDTALEIVGWAAIKPHRRRKSTAP